MSENSIEIKLLLQIFFLNPKYIFKYINKSNYQQIF